MERTWKPKVAGILLIILGIPEIVVGAMLIESRAWALPLMFAGITAVIAGVCALRRKSWGLVLAASICTPCAYACGAVLLGELDLGSFAALIGFPLGVLAIIFAVMGRGEFEGRAKPVVGTELCPACGAPTGTQTETCANCGARLGEAARPRTWKPKVGGILAIVAVVLAYRMAAVLYTGVGIPWGVGVAFYLLLVLSGTVAIVGAIYAIRRRAWGLVLAGSICALAVSTFGVILFLRPYLIAFLIPGIVALVLIIKGKPEFR